MDSRCFRPDSQEYSHYLEGPMRRKAGAEPSRSEPKARKLHRQRRKRVEKLLREIGSESAEHVRASRDPLEQVWSLTGEEFTRRVGRDGMKALQSAREVTMSVTKEIVRVEGEIDERVKSFCAGYN